MNIKNIDTNFGFAIRAVQGVNKLAKGLEVMALADDGLVEAVYMPDRSYVWAVQWHPEFSLKDEISKKIFSSFVGSVEKSI